MGKCPVCTKDAVLTVHHEKWVEKEKIMICNDCHVLINRYYQFLETNYDFKYGIGKYKTIGKFPYLDIGKEVQESQNKE